MACSEAGTYRETSNEIAKEFSTQMDIKPALHGVEASSPFDLATFFAPPAVGVKVAGPPQVDVHVVKVWNVVRYRFPDLVIDFSRIMQDISLDLRLRCE